MLLLNSCISYDRYENVSQFSFEDFPVQKELVGNVLEFDSLIMRPRDIFVLDSVLVVVETGMDELFHVFCTTTRCLLEMLSPFTSSPAMYARTLPPGLSTASSLWLPPSSMCVKWSCCTSESITTFCYFSHFEVESYPTPPWTWARLTDYLTHSMWLKWCSRISS